MPRPIGEFISKHVYDGQLKTEHSITRASACLRFVDIDGHEKKHGVSTEVSAPRKYTPSSELNSFAPIIFLEHPRSQVLRKNSEAVRKGGEELSYLDCLRRSATTH